MISLWSPLKEDSILQLSQLEPPNARFHPNAAAPRQSKIFHDRVHDQIVLHPALVKIVDTPQFQRLRDLHQLGNTRYIYTSATNTRFEHSIGTSFLATRMLKTLRSNHEEIGPPLDVSEVDVICVGMAGLCHDLGHGPLSHAFEAFVNEYRAKTGDPHEWEHEVASVQMLNHILSSNNIDLSEFGMGAHDISFVKLLIHGIKPSEEWPAASVCRPESKRWLCDIVANKRNGIDVDKMDYFLRDSMSCFGKLPDLHVDRILNCARVISSDGQFQVCFQQKVALSLNDMFSLRAKLHKFVYQHRVVLVIDSMIKDALMHAEGGFRIPVIQSDGSEKHYTLSECVSNIEAFALTGDWIFSAMQATTSPDLAKTREILRRIRQRKLYTLTGMFGAKKPFNITDLRNQIVQFMDPADRIDMPDDNILLLSSVIRIGSSGDSKVQDPLNNVRFFNPKKNWNEAFPLSEQRISPLFVPSAYEERTYFVFSKDPHFSEAVFSAVCVWLRERKSKQNDVLEPVPFANPSPGSLTGKKRPRGDEQRSLSPPPPLPLFDISGVN
jgi:HD superfamily phosphohydrolase